MNATLLEKRWSDLSDWLASEEAADWWAEVGYHNSLPYDAATELLEAFGLGLTARTRERLDGLISEFVA